MPIIDPNRKVRVALDEDGYMLQCGDPDNKELDTEYMDFLRQGYQVKIITYSEYLKSIWSKLIKPQ